MNNFAIINTPIGYLKIKTNSTSVNGIEFLNPKDKLTEVTPQKKYSYIMNNTIKELSEYFFENRTNFTVKIQISLAPFYRKVLSKVAEVPFGKTASYKDIAIKLKNENAARVVGTANKKNPIPIIIPCHRIISSSGKLGGYNSGFKKKIFLLKHEGLHFDF